MKTQADVLTATTGQVTKGLWAQIVMRVNFASIRLAFFLIAILIVFILLSALIPQQDISQGQILDWKEKLGGGYVVIEKLALDRIYNAPYFFVVLGLLAVNLVAGNIKRFRLIYRAGKPLLRARHLGSIVFHLSLLLIMAAAILHYLFKYEGVFSLTEGQTVSDDVSDYFREFMGPLYSTSYDGFSIRLEEIGNISGETGDLGSRASITFLPSDGDPVSADIQTNHPLKWKELEFHFGSTAGYSPELLLLDREDKVLFRSFVRVASKKREGRIAHSDFVMLPGENLKLAVEVLSRGTPVDSNRFHIDVRRDTTLLYDGILLPADTAAFDRYKIAVPRLRRWCYIGVIRNPYLGLVFFGFWSGLAGLTLTFVSRLAGKR